MPVAVLLGAWTGLAGAADWPSWRGPNQNGISEETGLVSTWSPEGENVVWRQDFTGRSTPIVIDGRVFVGGRAGEGADRRELVAAFDARTGERLWEHPISTALTTVPFNRAGWPSPAADRETGYVYVQGVAGPFLCLDRDGNVVWEKHLYEEFGRFSGYGGRTHTPLVDEDRVIVNVINGSWGKLGPPRHRYFAFDKRTGDVLWIATPGGMPFDRNTTSNAVVAVIGGQRLYITGNADGHVYALNARTGETVWSFQLSKRGINSSPVVTGNTVIIGHSEENIDEASLGRVVAIDATGRGDVTKTHEKWRRSIAMGFPSPLVDGDQVYVINNSANLYALDLETGDTRWELSLGTVGKSAPVLADGKLYVTEVNGHFHILKPSATGVEQLDKDQLHVPSGRYAETYGSPAIAYGRIYFTTEEGLYCLGDPEREFEIEASPPQALGAEADGGTEPALLHVVPADLTVGIADQPAFSVRAFNRLGQPVQAPAVTWSLAGLRGEIDTNGSLRFAGDGTQAGEVVAQSGELEARARVRAFAPLPMVETFDDIEGRGRPWWIGGGRYQVSDLDGEKVLEKPVAPAGLLRSGLLIGPHEWTDYTIEADVRATQKGRRRSDVGLINSGYVLDLKGVRQELEIKTWEAVKRIAVAQPYEWPMDTWYRLKLRVDRNEDGAWVRGKVWKLGDPEPAEWTIETRDHLGPPTGAPGVVAYSPASAYYDNIKVTVNR